MIHQGSKHAGWATGHSWQQSLARESHKSGPTHQVDEQVQGVAHVVHLSGVRLFHNQLRIKQDVGGEHQQTAVKLYCRSRARFNTQAGVECCSARRDSKSVCSNSSGSLLYADGVQTVRWECQQVSLVARSHAPKHGHESILSAAHLQAENCVAASKDKAAHAHHQHAHHLRTCHVSMKDLGVI